MGEVIVLPEDWELMTDPKSGKEVPLRVIDLTATSDGYKFVLAEFHKTMTPGSNYTSIIKIQRLQNPALYGQYAAKKKHLDAHNPGGTQNECWLFHGTRESSISQINQTNFNRSFRGQNGTITLYVGLLIDKSGKDLQFGLNNVVLIITLSSSL